MLGFNPEADSALARSHLNEGRLELFQAKVNVRGDVALPVTQAYCGKPSTANMRKVAYLSPIFRSSLN